MYQILKKKALNPTVTMMVVKAPMVARKAEPGQFIILRVDEDGERMPLTIADYDRENGTITIIFQIVGATTEALNHKEEGEFIQDFVGPLGKATETEGLKKVAVVGGGVGCAIAYPVAKKLHEQGCEVHSIVGFRNKDLVILEDEFKNASAKMLLMTDDGSYGEKGLVTDALRKLIESGEQYYESYRRVQISITDNTIVSEGDDDKQLMKIDALSGEPKVTMTGNTWNGSDDSLLNETVSDNSYTYTL